jgi:hypothetical protein
MALIVPMTGTIGQDFMAVGCEKPAGGANGYRPAQSRKWLCRVCGGGSLTPAQRKIALREAGDRNSNIVEVVRAGAPTTSFGKVMLPD